jgi:dimethylhistidine N-methyltransferase
MTISTSSPPRRLSVITPRADSHLEDFACDVAAGLARIPKQLSCRYFYDREGSHLFEQICDLPEYYLTRAEAEVLRQRAGEVSSRLAAGTTLVELGSGSAAKTRLLIEALLSRQESLRYVPVDISRSMLEETARILLETYPGLEITAIAGEYGDGLRQLRAMPEDPKLILWLGSNVGNFERPDAAAFLRATRETMRTRDRLLVGIDLRKDPGVLEPAYDDSRGVTARFNLNLLARINRELGGHFDLAAFRHRAVYDEEIGRIEMYLVSTRPQRVAIDGLGLQVPFAAGESIHTENSYKYSIAEIEALAEAAGLQTEARWFDAGDRFSLNLFVPAPDLPRAEVPA